MTYEEIMVRQNRHWRGEKFPTGIERAIKYEIMKSLDTKYILVVRHASELPHAKAVKLPAALILH